MTPQSNLDDDAYLVLQARAGNRSALANLLNRHYPSILRLCQRLLGSPWDAEDVAQDAALETFLGLERLKEPSSFGAWFHAIAANLARRALRRQHPASLEAQDDTTPLTMLWTEGSLPPEDAVLDREIHECIVSALSELSPINRDMIIAFYLSGYSMKELAALEQVPISTIRGRLYQGRRQLEEALRPVTDVIQGQPQKESAMEQNEWIPVQRSRFLFPFAPEGFASPTVVELRQVNGAWAFPLRINQAEGEILWSLPTDQTPEALMQSTRPVVQGSTLKMMKALGIHVERIRIERLVDTTYFASVSYAQGDRVYETEIRPGEALLLTAFSGAPLYVARSVIESVGYSWQELLAYLNKSQSAQEPNQLRQKILARVQARKSETSTIPLDAHRQHQLGQLLERLKRESGARLAFILDHQSGDLIAWTGTGNVQDLNLLGRVLSTQATSLTDLRDLLLYVHWLIGQVSSGDPMPFAQVGMRWQMDLVVPRATMENANPVKQPYYDQAITELKRIVDQLEPGTELQRG